MMIVAVEVSRKLNNRADYVLWCIRTEYEIVGRAVAADPRRGHMDGVSGDAPGGPDAQLHDDRGDGVRRGGV
jgi:hypothetical protein